MTIYMWHVFLCILYSRVQLALQMQIIHLFFMITNIFDRLQSISTEPTRRIKTLFWCVCCCAFDWIFSLVKFIKKYWEVQIVWCKQPNVCQKTKDLCNLSIKCSFFLVISQIKSKMCIKATSVCPQMNARQSIYNQIKSLYLSSVQFTDIYLRGGWGHR